MIQWHTAQLLHRMLHEFSGNMRADGKKRVRNSGFIENIFGSSVLKTGNLMMWRDN